VEICDQVREYVNQDYVSLREIPQSPQVLNEGSFHLERWLPENGEIRPMSKTEKQKLQARFRFTEMQMKVADLIFWQKKTQIEGSQFLGISQPRISSIIKSIRHKMENRRSSEVLSS
jgi:DNA-directed RNA polymerase specialized sigma subunit